MMLALTEKFCKMFTDRVEGPDFWDNAAQQERDIRIVAFEQTWRDMFSSPTSSLDAARNACAKALGVHVELILGKDRQQSIAFARMVTAYCLAKMTSKPSASEIAACMWRSNRGLEYLTETCQARIDAGEQDVIEAVAKCKAAIGVRQECAA
jgi:hypothetical protein